MGVIDFALLIRSAFLPIAAFFLDYGLAVTRHAFKQALLVHRRVYKRSMLRMRGILQTRPVARYVYLSQKPPMMVVEHVYLMSDACSRHRCKSPPAEDVLRRARSDIDVMRSMESQKRQVQSHNGKQILDSCHFFRLGAGPSWLAQIILKMPDPQPVSDVVPDESAKPKMAEPSTAPSSEPRARRERKQANFFTPDEPKSDGQRKVIPKVCLDIPSCCLRDSTMLHEWSALPPFPDAVCQ